MNELAGKYEGQDRYECRKNWVSDLEAAGYLVKTEEKVIPMGTVLQMPYGYRRYGIRPVVRKDGRTGKTGNRSCEKR